MMKNIYRKYACELARWLLESSYLSGDPHKIALHDARATIQQLKQENSRLSIANTVLKTKIWMVNL
jgi:hypothetical protein